MGKLRTWVLCSALIALATVRGTDAADTSNFDNFLPPSFSGAQGQALAGIFVSCQGMLNSGIDQIGQAFMQDNNKQKGPYTVGTECNGPESAPDSSTIQCDRLWQSGNYNRAPLEAFEQQCNAARQTLLCKKNKLAALRGELQCLSNASTMLEQQVTSLKDAYAQNINRMQQDVQKLNQMIGDREFQFQRAGEMLGEINKAKEKTQALVQAMPGEILGIKEQQKTEANLRQAIEEQVQVRTMSLASECFKSRPVPGCQIKVGGPSVSAYQCVVERYRQNLYLGKNGTIRQGDAIVDKEANAGADALKGLLETILGDAPGKDGLQVKQSFDQAVAVGDQPLTVLSAADVEDQFGDQLTKFNAAGLDIHNFVVKTMGSCFQRATKVVSKERRKATSTIGRMVYDVTEKERLTAKNINDLLIKYNQQWTENMSSLTRQNLPLNISLCQRAKPDIQLGCLEDIRANMEGLLNGNVPQAMMQLQVDGKDPTNQIRFQCAGLTGCSTSLVNVQRKIQQDTERIKNYKSSYVLQANQSIKGFTDQMAKMLSVQSSFLEQRRNTLNNALASLGVSSTLTFQALQGAQWQKDQDGLYQPPNDAKELLRLLGGQTTPPMPDISPETFSGAMSGVASRTNELNSKEASVLASLNSVQGMEYSCKQSKVGTLIGNLSTKVDKLTDCASSVDWCRSRDPSAVEEITSNFDQIAAGVDYGTNIGTQLTAVSTSLSGVGSACNDLLSEYNRCVAANDEKTCVFKAKTRPPGCNSAAITNIKLGISQVGGAMGSNLSGGGF